MKILVISDTHRKNENLFRVLEKTGTPDLLIHCGDVEGSEYTISQAAGCPVEMVAGNNDFFSQLEREKEIMIGKYKVLLTHGHYYNVSTGPAYLKQEAKERGFDGCWPKSNTIGGGNIYSNEMTGAQDAQTAHRSRRIFLT